MFVVSPLQVRFSFASNPFAVELLYRTCYRVKFYLKRPLTVALKRSSRLRFVSGSVLLRYAIVAFP